MTSCAICLGDLPRGADYYHPECLESLFGITTEIRRDSAGEYFRVDRLDVG